LAEETKNFNDELGKAPADCEAALKALGRLSHSWQDFYAHAIRSDGTGGNENSPAPGWVAWTYVDPATGKPAPVTGSPEDTSDFNPSSYGNFDSEHPKYKEPLIKDGAEYKARYDAAQAYTQSQFQQMIPQWWAKCGCWCNEKK